MASQQESAARKGLDKVLRSHAAILKDVPSGVAAAKISGKGMFYRAWLGQFASAAEARSLCDRLKAGGVACTISQAHSDDTRISLSKL
jgi:cell division septation protein DedD